VVNAGNFMLFLIKPSTCFEIGVEILYQLARRLSNETRSLFFLTNQTPSNYLALNLLRY
jgi:hypothetical protein